MSWYLAPGAEPQGEVPQVGTCPQEARLFGVQQDPGCDLGQGRGEGIPACPIPPLMYGLRPGAGQG